MILDTLLQFTGTRGGTSSGTMPGTGTIDADSLTGAASTYTASQLLDLGVASGVPSSANGGGARDLGIGDNPSLELSILATTAFAGGTSVSFALQGAPDNGSGAPGSYTTMWSSGAIVTANLDAGQQLANVTVPRTVPGQPMPRFLRLQATSVGVFTGAASNQFQANIVLDRDDQPVGTDGAYSGYPAGILVAN